MRRFAAPPLFLLCLLAGATAAQAPGAAQTDRLCAIGPAWPEPVPATVAGCPDAVCTGAGSERLCTCRRGDSFRFERRDGPRIVQHWATEVAPIMGPAAFEVLPADVDGDGQPEWLVLRHQGSSNGLGVSWQTLCVLWPQQPQRAPLCRDTSEWGALTVLVQEAGRKGCSLMDSGWQPGREPGRGEGTYAVGRLHRLQGSRWVAAATGERPPVARRLLDEFMAERESLPQRNAQRLWYQHPLARELRCPGSMCKPPPR